MKRSGDDCANGVRRLLLAAMLLVMALLPGCEADQPPLPAGQAVIEGVSVSGLSSGAYMAGQFQMAHAGLVRGAGLVAGGPYGCAENAYARNLKGPGAAFFNLTQAINGCMLNAMQSFGIPDPEALVAKARERARNGVIDPLDDLRHHRVYLFSGTSDRAVVTPIVEAAASFYRLAGVRSENLRFVDDVTAGHAFVTDDAGLECGASGSPYLNDCDYDQAGAILRHIYGELDAKAEVRAASFITFDQSQFTHGLDDHGLANAGVAYIPQTCSRTNPCRVHVVFHGRNQNREKVGDTFVTESGFGEWAESNRLIILFPQTRISTLNPQACWDWWGYTGSDYLTADGSQLVAVKRMLDHLADRVPLI